jgi:hypothetical protein
MSNGGDGGLPIEDFIQALSSQLDRAQTTLALKARAGLPLTFAVKDIALELRTHIEVTGSVVRIRPAGPGDTDASVIHLTLTTITKPMIEENTMPLQLSAPVDEPPLQDVLGSDISPEEQRRLEWAGIYSVRQLRDVQHHGGEEAIGRVANIPISRLRAALQRATLPFISRVAPVVPPHGVDEPPLVRIHGHNLVEDGPPQVRIGGEGVPVLQATKRELLVSPLPHQMVGTLQVETAPGSVGEAHFDLTPYLSRRTPTISEEPV